MVSALKTGIHKAKDVAAEANISPHSALYQYQHMAAVETGLILLTKEQMGYLEQKYQPVAMAVIEAQIEAQSESKDKPDKLSYTNQAQNKSDFTD